MSSKNTWLWITLAAALFGFIYVFERYFHHPPAGPKYLLPGFEPKTVTTVQIRPAGLMEIHAERTNGAWRLVEPVNYPAENDRVEDLLDSLKQLTVVHHISEQELRKDPKADEDY